MNTTITTITTRAEAIEEAHYLRQRASDSLVALGDCTESQEWEREASEMEALADSIP